MLLQRKRTTQDASVVALVKVVLAGFPVEILSGYPFVSQTFPRPRTLIAVGLTVALWAYAVHIPLPENFSERWKMTVVEQVLRFTYLKPVHFVDSFVRNYVCDISLCSRNFSIDSILCTRCCTHALFLICMRDY